MRKIFSLLLCAAAFVSGHVFGQTQYIVNGGFELVNAGEWVISGTGAYLTNGAAAASGTGYLTMGNVANASQAVYQIVTLPTNLIAATFSFNYEIVTADTFASDDTLSVYILDTNHNGLVNLGSTGNTSGAANEGYFAVSTNLVTYTGQTNFSSYAGESIEVYFQVTTDPVFGYSTTFNLDNVSLLVGTTANIPANDDFTNATPILADGISITNINTTYASKEPGEPNHAGNAGGHSVWWTWTAPANGIVKINTAGSSFQTLLAVYTGAVLTNLTPVAASNDGGPNPVTFKASTGATYDIALDGYNGASGTADLNFSFVFDTTPPKVAISTPAAGAKVTNSTVVVTGTASDNVAVGLVEFRLENASGTNTYQIATGTNNWSATVTDLIPGSNTVRVIAIDTSSNVSASVSRVLVYAVPVPLTLTISGGGSVSGAANGQLLDLNLPYRITAKPAAGFGFAGWTGSLVNSNAALSFLMQSNLTLQANFRDITPPTLTIVTPKSVLRVSNELFTASGTAKDNVAVSNVLVQLNASPWTNATTLNNWTNWFATNLALLVGTNTLSACSVDTTGNKSLTNTVKFIYVLSDKLNVQIVGSGTVSPNLNQMFLQISNSYTIKALPGKGFGFGDWTDGVTTNLSPSYTFIMHSNLLLTAVFVDTTRPVCIITNPVARQTLTNAAPTAAGKASDNVGVIAVMYQLNNAGWSNASLGANSNSWSTPVLLPVSGSNVISAFALDAAGNASLTNSIVFKYLISTVADWAPGSLNGLLAAVTPAEATNGLPENVGFDVTTFAQTGLNADTNADDYGAGAYTYAKTSTNTAQLQINFTTPPNVSNNLAAVQLVFTNHYAGYFTNAGGDSGGFIVAVATNWLPATLANRTLMAIDSGRSKTNTIKLGANGTFTKTPPNNGGNGTSSGNYTFARFSPVSGMVTFSFTDAADAGQVVYVQITFTSAAAGTYLVTSFDNTGQLQDTGTGTFTLH